MASFEEDAPKSCVFCMDVGDVEFVLKGFEQTCGRRVEWGEEGGGGFVGFFRVFVWVCVGVSGWGFLVKNAMDGLGWKPILEEYL